MVGETEILWHELRRSDSDHDNVYSLLPFIEVQLPFMARICYRNLELFVMAIY